jgi:small ligand-binding sensory domain FIST
VLNPSIQAASETILSTFDESAVRRAAESCLQRIGGASHLAVVFASPDYREHLAELAEIVQVYGHVARIVGCSATGLAGGGREHEQQAGLSLLFLRMPHTSIEVHLISDEQDGLDQTHPGEPAPAIALLHPFRLQPQDWLEQWNALHPAVPCVGGLASGTWDQSGIFLFTEAGPIDAAGVVIRLVGGVRLETVVSQGCRPIGDSLMVTGAHENLLTSLSGRPAWQVLNETVRGLLDEGVEISPGCIHVGLAMTEFLEDYGRGDFLVRNIIGGDHESGIVQLGAIPYVGQTVQFQFRDRDSASEDLNHQLHWIKKLRPQPPVAGLLFTCGGRGLEFFSEPNHDAGMIDDVMGPVPLAGFFSAGEIGPVGLTTYLHGYTASAVFFYDV